MQTENNSCDNSSDAMEDAELASLRAAALQTLRKPAAEAADRRQTSSPSSVPSAATNQQPPYSTYPGGAYYSPSMSSHPAAFPSQPPANFSKSYANPYRYYSHGYMAQQGSYSTQQGSYPTQQGSYSSHYGPHQNGNPYARSFANNRNNSNLVVLHVDEKTKQLEQRQADRKRMGQPPASDTVQSSPERRAMPGRFERLNDSSDSEEDDRIDL